ncbi:MAG: hypothetical protein HQM09_19040 [Candidatus Riflebacteria bacterium]|nr:hypothetical protein [Candidatus Riflebacteria bacterium]
MSPAAQALTDYMSELSETAYCAGWMDGLEFALWQVVTEGPRQYGCLVITQKQVSELRMLSDICGGWIVFDDRTEETFISLDAWQRLYNDHINNVRCTINNEI